MIVDLMFSVNNEVVRHVCMRIIWGYTNNAGSNFSIHVDAIYIYIYCLNDRQISLLLVCVCVCV